MIRRILFILLFVIGTALPARAADFDGSAPIYCAFTKILECQGKKGCDYAFPDEIFLPAFVRIEFQKNLISATRGDETLTTPIRHLQRQGGYLILQGIEQRAWSLMIAEKTGTLTLAVAGEDDGFVVFGSCMAPSR